MWHMETIQLVMWCCLDVLAVVFECLGRQKGGVAIGDGNNVAMVVVNLGWW